MTDVNNMINVDGDKKYAYATLIMLNNIYASPAIVLAESIRKLGSLADLIIYVDKNLDKNTVDLLRKFYDKIIMIDIKLLEIENKNKTQKYILNKLCALELTNYEKVIMIDIDCIIFKNIDKVFMMNEPGLILIKGPNNIEKMSTGLVLIKPDKQKFDEVKNLLKDEKIEKEEKPLIYVLKKIYENINTFEDTILSSNKYDESSDGIQYNVDKPFLMSSDKPIEDRIKLDIFKVWFYYFANILNKYPDIRKYKCLEETIQVSKYFLSGIGRTIVLFRNISKYNKFDNVKNIYGIQKRNNLEYYHLNISKEYDNTNVNYLVNNMDLNNFINYIKSKNSLFDNLYNDGEIADIILQIKDEDLINYFLSEYIRMYTNVFAILLVNDDNIKENKNQVDIINNLIFTKEFTISGVVLKNILFNINQEYVYNERIEYLSTFDSDKKYNVILKIYKFIQPLNDLNEFNKNNKKIFIFNDTNSKIRFSSVFLNRNSLKKFNKKELVYLKKNKIDKNKLINIMKFQTLKKFIYNIWDGEEISNLIIVEPMIILDTNVYKLGEIKKIIDKKIELIEIIFTNVQEYKKVASKYKQIIKNINNPKYYYEIEGIKFFNKN
jgi:hypothetical protein